MVPLYSGGFDYISIPDVLAEKILVPMKFRVLVGNSGLDEVMYRVDTKFASVH
jgi:hypothetical protein